MFLATWALQHGILGHQSQQGGSHHLIILSQKCCPFIFAILYALDTSHQIRLTQGEGRITQGHEHQEVGISGDHPSHLLPQPERRGKCKACSGAGAGRDRWPPAVRLRLGPRWLDCLMLRSR